MHNLEKHSYAVKSLNDHPLESNMHLIYNPPKLEVAQELKFERLPTKIIQPELLEGLALAL